jgi:hypothetical protein
MLLLLIPTRNGLVPGIGIDKSITMLGTLAQAANMMVSQN